jgi:hypothetical protein
VYSSEYNIRVDKSRRVRWTAHVERIEEKSILRFGGECEVKNPLGKSRCA